MRWKKQPATKKLSSGNGTAHFMHANKVLINVKRIDNNKEETLFFLLFRALIDFLFIRFELCLLLASCSSQCATKMYPMNVTREFRSANKQTSMASRNRTKRIVSAKEDGKKRNCLLYGVSKLVIILWYIMIVYKCFRFYFASRVLVHTHLLRFCLPFFIGQ